MGAHGHGGRAPGGGGNLSASEARGARTFVEVLVDRAGGGPSEPLTYHLPPGLAQTVSVGSAVLVPLMKQRVCGYVVAVTPDPPPFKTRAVLAALSPEPLFDSRLLALARWVARQYACDLLPAVKCLLPPGLIQRTARHVEVTEGASAALASLEQTAPRQARVLREIIERGGRASYWALRRRLKGRDVAAALRDLAQRGLIREETSLQGAGAQKHYETVVELAVGGLELETARDALSRRAPRQAAVLQVLREVGGGLPEIELRRRAHAPDSAVRALAGKGLVRRVRREALRTPVWGLSGGRAEPFPLTRAQQAALDKVQAALDGAGTRTVLLHGVTSSGKTEVYLQAIELALRRGLQAVVIVPEIALTPQIVGRFEARFPGRTALLHSHLSAGERYDEWRRVREGLADVVIGARSAIFAPVLRLGLIIVDEEHETAYKQESDPRYHAREVALARAELEGAAVVMGSATPSLETYHRAQAGEFALAELPDRIDHYPLPPVELVDLRQEHKAGSDSPLSRPLREAIGEALGRGEQVLLFLNRRGFSTFVLCWDCGKALRCPNCEVSLTFHRRTRDLRCHHCEFARRPPDECEACGGTDIGYLGAGTERIEELIARDFPQARIARLDRDTTSRKGEYVRILQDFADRETDVLVGTQMVAKGLDFPGVSLVGVIHADTSLNFPDFRAAERTFQILTQVSGRAGRAGEGRVIVQTVDPEHYAIVAAKNHDYRAFYQEEIEFRRDLGYPPFGCLVRLVATGRYKAPTEELIALLAEHLRAEAEKYDAQAQVLGPAAAPLGRLNRMFRQHVLLKGPDRQRLLDVVQGALRRLTTTQRAKITVDVDPISMM
jgi:primosomal protein N' (replication factor Y)